MAQVFLFGPLADVLETGSTDIEITASIATVQDVLNELAERGPNWQRNLQADKLQITVNRQFVDAGASVTNADEIALIPLPGRI